MVVTYVLEEAELDEDFYQKLKIQFKDKKLSITIAEEQDETAYLSANPANAERLLKAVENAKKPEGLVTVDMDKLTELLAK